MLPTVIIHPFSTIGQPPRLNYTKSGTPVCNARVACNEGKEEGQITTWVNVTAWGFMAEELGRANQGDTIAGSGKWTQRSYEKEGQRRVVDEIKLDSLHITAKKQRQENQPLASDDDMPF